MAVITELEPGVRQVSNIVGQPSDTREVDTEIVFDTALKHIIWDFQGEKVGFSIAPLQGQEGEVLSGSFLGDTLPKIVTARRIGYIYPSQK